MTYSTYLSGSPAKKKRDNVIIFFFVICQMQKIMMKNNNARSENQITMTNPPHKRKKKLKQIYQIRSIKTLGLVIHKCVMEITPNTPLPITYCLLEWNEENGYVCFLSPFHLFYFFVLLPFFYFNSFYLFYSRSIKISESARKKWWRRMLWVC